MNADGRLRSSKISGSSISRGNFAMRSTVLPAEVRLYARLIRSVKPGSGASLCITWLLRQSQNPVKSPRKCVYQSTFQR